MSSGPTCLAQASGSALRALPAVVALLFGLLLFLAPMGAQAAPITLRGEVSYRERMALPRGTRLVVQLADVSRADARAKIVARTLVDHVSGSPVGFTLRTDSRKFLTGRSYVLQARISDRQGNLLFINEAAYPWRPADAGPLVIRLVRTGGPAAAPPPRKRAQEPWGRWVAEDILGGGVVDSTRSVIEIAPDGRFTGNGGCNGLNGQVRVNGKRLAFGRIASTNMACPAAAMSQEQKFHDALGKARSFRVEAGQSRLFLLDSGNRVVMRLAAAPG